MCKKAGETVLIYCYIVICNAIWSPVLCLFAEQWVMPNRVVDLLACWKGRFAKIL